MQRPSWEEYFMDIARLTAKRSNCIKRSVGCIIVKNKRILSLGYNGTPLGTTNCYEGGCPRCNANEESGSRLDLCLCLHAEENALMFIPQGDLQDSTMYVTVLPCIGCVKKIIQCKIGCVVYGSEYNLEMDTMSLWLLNKHNVRVQKLI